MSSPRFGILLALATAAAPLAAQRPAMARLAERLDPATAALVTRVVDSAAASGLPAGPLVNKALEGASKGAAPDRILVAVRTLAVDLRSARAALGSGATEAELVAGVGALRAGAEGDVLARVKRARGASSALLPLAVLTDLVAQGIPVDRAATVILALAERRAADAQYRTLPRAHGRGGVAPVEPQPGRGNAGNPPGLAEEPAGRPAADRPAGGPPAERPTPVDGPATGRPVEPPATGRPADPARVPPVDGPGKGRPPEPPAKGRPSRP